MLVGTLLVFVVASLWVPSYWFFATNDGEITATQASRSPHYEWAWARGGWGMHSPSGRLGVPGITETKVSCVAWPLLCVEHALILLLGGGLLTIVIRRDRRKAAAA